MATAHSNHDGLPNAKPSVEFSDGDNSFTAGRYVARYIIENALFKQVDIDDAFLELMGYLRECRPTEYTVLVNLARTSHPLRAAWQLILVDVLLCLNLAEMAEDNSLFEETAIVLCRRRAIPGAGYILSACFEVYAGSVDANRQEFIRGCILNGCD